jgi:hypothetical protein
MRLRSAISAGGVSRPDLRRGPRSWWPWNRARPADAHPLLRNRRCLRVASRRAGRIQARGAFLTWAVSGSARPCPSWVHEGYISALASQCAALPGSSGTRHGPAWTAAGTPGAPYDGKQGCAPTAASPRAAVRRIELIPSKIVKILDYGTISAVQRPCEGPWYQHGSSTRCSRVAAVRTRAKKAPLAYSPPGTSKVY